MMEFAIVEFVGDESVAVVPTRWVLDDDNGASCSWPPSKVKNVEKVVKDRMEPGTDWLSYSVRVLHKYETYNLARSNLTRAEITSGLETDGESLPPRKKQKITFTASDSDSEPLQPLVPPSLHLTAGKSAGGSLSRSVDRSVSRSPPRKTGTNKSSAGGSSSRSVSRSPPRKTGTNKSSAGGSLSRSVDRSQRSVSRSPPRKTGTNKSSAGGSSSRSVDRSVSQSPPRKTITNKSVVRSEDRSVSRSPPRKTGTNKSSAGGSSHSSSASETRLSRKEVVVILNRLAAIEAQQRVHSQMLQAILQATQQQQLLEACELPEGVTLPLMTLDDLMDLEKRLENIETKTILSRYLGAIGGRDVGDTSRRIMKQVFSIPLARKLNFAGRGQKTGIGHMAITSVIISAVRRNRILKKPTRAEVEDEMKVWLRQSVDGNGGRSLREQKKKKASAKQPQPQRDYSDVEASD